MSAGTTFGTEAVPVRARFFTRDAGKANPARTRSARPLWIRNEGDIRLEKWLLLLLAIAALIGIAYGFSCFIDLVQNWAAMERGISTLI